ncbi:MAG: carboxy terminal-processing peptidase [Succinivibrionaceae bacterium]
MKILSAMMGFVLGLGFVSNACAISQNIEVPNIKDVKLLKGTSQQYTSCKRITSYFTMSHYKEIALDNDFAKEVYRMYFDLTDYYNNLFTEYELKSIKSESSKLLKAMDSCEISYVFDLFHRVSVRRFEKITYQLSELDKKIDFTIDEYKNIDTHDPENREVYKTREDLENEWRKIVKNDLLNLMLSGKTEEKSKEILRKRYIYQLNNIVKFKNEDAFSVFENAFARSIDPHTSYLSPEASSNFDNEMNLSMEGIGAVLTQDDDYITVVSIVPGSPAEKSKQLKPKDKIIGVQQHKKDESDVMIDIIGWRVNDAVSLIKGEKGSKVTLEIQRGEGSSLTTFKVELVRDKIKLEDSAAKGEVKEIDGRKVGVLTVKSFYMNLAKDMKREIEKLKSQGIEALVVDLRNNGGGALSEAIDSTGLFITKGPILQVRDSLGNVIDHKDKNEIENYTGPLVVLINRLSASSSEIFAAALQDYKRAVIVGDTSFGKGTVQQSRPLDRLYDFFDSNLGSIHYTIAKFYRISGGSTQLQGVKPDISFPIYIDHSKVGEVAEPNALIWDKVPKANYKYAGDVDKYLPQLIKKHEDRVSKNELFGIFKKQIEDSLQEDNKKVISLKYDIRKEEYDKKQAKTLFTTNALLRATGFPEIKNMKDLPSDFEPLDIFLIEAERIALDLKDLSKK